jgi:hypothetical protein
MHQQQERHTKMSRRGAPSNTPLGTFVSNKKIDVRAFAHFCHDLFHIFTVLDMMSQVRCISTYK